MRMHNLWLLAPEQPDQAEEGFDVLYRADFANHGGQPNPVEVFDSGCPVDQQPLRTCNECEIVSISGETLETHQRRFLCSAQFEFRDDVNNLRSHSIQPVWH